MPKLLSGTKVRDELIIGLTKKFESAKITASSAIELAIIQVGNRPDSNSYIQAKVNFAKKVGINALLINLPDSVSESEIIEKIKECNSDSKVKGIIVQLPLPADINKDNVINSIDVCKDIDGLTASNVRLLSLGRPEAIVPATARGVMELLKYYKIFLNGKKVTVIGRSALVGKPIAQLCTNAGAVVTVAHSKTIDLIKETKSANIIIVAVGKKNLIRSEHVTEGQVIIDVGINRNDQSEIIEISNIEKPKKVVGDVDFEAVSKVIGSSGAISPVPGGVGPMTVLCLFENLADICGNDICDKMSVLI